MSRGSNAGAAGAGRGSRAEARSLDAFFMATRRGMLETLRFQAEARAIDLLWQPQLVARRTIRIVERVRPDAILVDHLAFAATIGLRAMGVAVRRCRRRPPHGPAGRRGGLRRAIGVAVRHHGRPGRSWRRCGPSLAGSARPSAMPTIASCARWRRGASRSAMPSPPTATWSSTTTPRELHEAARTALLPRHAFLGSAVRHESPDDETAAWLARADGRPLVVVSLGTFLSARSDVLARVAAALRRVEARVAIAIGTNSPEVLGPVPSDWLVRASLPQVALLGHASLLVTHGGNNSVTEALTHGVPLLVMPFSTRPVRRRRRHRATPGRCGARPEPRQPAAHRRERPRPAQVATADARPHRRPAPGAAGPGDRVCGAVRRRPSPASERIHADTHDEKRRRRRPPPDGRSDGRSAVASPTRLLSTRSR